MSESDICLREVETVPKRAVARESAAHRLLDSRRFSLAASPAMDVSVAEARYSNIADEEDDSVCAWPSQHVLGLTQRLVQMRLS